MAQIQLDRGHIFRGSLILVSPDYGLQSAPLSEQLVPVLDAQPEVLMEKRAATLLQRLLEPLNKDGAIATVSGFRTRREQEQIWADTEDEMGSDFTRKYVAVPDHSEHQTGLAVDLAKNSPEIDFIRPHFPREGVFQKFRLAAPWFGFIERYPGAKEHLTGIGGEPWHFRYVGFPHSLIITEKGYVLEEYIRFLKETTFLHSPFTYHRGNVSIDIAYVPMEDADEKAVEIRDDCPCLISGTNEGGIVISLWRSGHGK